MANLGRTLWKMRAERLVAALGASTEMGRGNLYRVVDGQV